MPKSAFLLYSQAKREEVKGKHPGLDVVGVTKMLGEEWRKLSEEEKQEWKAKAAANESEGVEEEEFVEGEEGAGGEVGE
jgi:HMG box factor